MTKYWYNILTTQHWHNIATTMGQHPLNVALFELSRAVDTASSLHNIEATLPQQWDNILLM